MPKTLTYLLILLAGGLIGFLIATSIKKKDPPPVKPDPPIIKEDSIKIIKEDTVIHDSSNIEDVDPPVDDDNPGGDTPPPPRETNGQLPTGTKCFADDTEFSLQLTLFSEQMERDSIWYNNKEPEKLQDCSGIFHRMLRFVKSKCDSYEYPTTKMARDSRSLAGWFHKHNNLVIIDDPKKRAELIRPGSVMFFGGSGKRYNQMTIEQLSAPYPNGIVEHIGMVTEVNKDENGNVVGYVMMHGRRPGVTAQRSHYHNIKPPRLGYPVLGNWNQQWLAIAYSMTPKKAS